MAPEAQLGVAARCATADAVVDRGWIAEEELGFSNAVVKRKRGSNLAGCANAWAV